MAAPKLRREVNMGKRKSEGGAIDCGTFVAICMTAIAGVVALVVWMTG